MCARCFNLPALTLTFSRPFPEVQFVDYTKNVKRALMHAAGMLPKNYHLTFSRSQKPTGDDCVKGSVRGWQCRGCVQLTSFRRFIAGGPWSMAISHDLRFMDGCDHVATTAAASASRVGHCAVAQRPEGQARRLRLRGCGCGRAVKAYQAGACQRSTLARLSANPVRPIARALQPMGSDRLAPCSSCSSAGANDRARVMGRRARPQSLPRPCSRSSALSLERFDKWTSISSTTVRLRS